MSNSINQQNAIYAILADSIYWDIRKETTTNITGSNWTPIPSDWTLVEEMSGSGDKGKEDNPEYEGFTARAYQNGNKIVIAYAGTHDSDIKGDVKADLYLASGLGNQQANLAALFYQQIVVDPKYKGTDIEFTGHSLGGGLAAIMSIWFNRPAHVFDQAPFKSAVTNVADVNVQNPDGFLEEMWQFIPPSIRPLLKGDTETLSNGSTIRIAKEYLLKNFGVIHEEFAAYSPSTDFDSRVNNITATAIKGEFLEKLFASYGFRLPYPANLIQENINFLADGETSLGVLGALDKHSQTLLTTALLDKNFEHYLTLKDGNNANVDTLRILLDKEFYAYSQDSDKQNFLTKLIRSHVGANGGGKDYTTGDNVGIDIQSAKHSLLTTFGQTLKLLADTLKPYDMN
ncbi:MAG: hypothetical protein Q4G18_13355, partial [Myroides sp.]|nr:hypothetical protein [Myroides sp.]